MGILEKNITVINFSQLRKYLFWDVKIEELNEAAVVERILNYGDWDDVQEMFNVIGIKEVAEIFRRQILLSRNNYDKKISNYFSLYFDKYA